MLSSVEPSVCSYQKRFLVRRRALKKSYTILGGGETQRFASADSLRPMLRGTQHDKHFAVSLPRALDQRASSRSTPGSSLSSPKKPRDFPIENPRRSSSSPPRLGQLYHSGSPGLFSPFRVTLARVCPRKPVGRSTTAFRWVEPRFWWEEEGVRLATRQRISR